MQKVRYYGTTHTDSGVRENEDSFLLLNHRKGKEMIILACIADGVGGMDEGKLASSFIIESFAEWFNKEKDRLAEQGVKKATEQIYEKLMKIHEALKAIAMEKEIKCGSTVTVMLLLKDNFLMLHVGDSRAYLYSRGEIRQITKDQTLGQMERDKGSTGKDDVIVQKRKENMLLQCMGVGKLIPQVYEGELPKKYVVLLCSDGLSNTLTKEEIGEELGKKDVKIAKQHLISLTSLARERMEKDNITSIIVKRDSAEEEKQYETEAE